MFQTRRNLIVNNVENTENGRRSFRWKLKTNGELDPTCMPKLRVCMLQLRSPPAATKTQHNQINK